MELSKVLTLVIAAIIAPLNPELFDVYTNVVEQCNQEMYFFEKEGELVLSTTEYSCSENGQELQFHFKNDSLIDELHSFQIRRIEFCLNDIRLVAKGNLIYQSSLPEGADYYFIIDDDGIVQLSRSERILYMRKVSRS